MAAWIAVGEKDLASICIVIRSVAKGASHLSWPQSCAKPQITRKGVAIWIALKCVGKPVTDRPEGMPKPLIQNGWFDGTSHLTHVFVGARRSIWPLRFGNSRSVGATKVAANCTRPQRPIGLRCRHASLSSPER